LQATIRLEYDDAETAQAVADAISPDNCTAPAGLTVNSKEENAVVTTEITLDGKLVTLIATIDDLLESASTVEKTLHVVKRKKYSLMT
jgi:hypothetical protein